jgi:enoyl-CoA hydratase/carnithine racemase
VAEVGGLATAAGCQLVATCDIAVAADSARFGVNGIDVGLFCSTPMVALSRNVAPKTALDMLMTGEMISAGRALSAGLVSRVAPAAELRAETDKVIDRLLARPPNVLALGKHAFYEQLRMPVAEAYLFASATIVDNMLMDEAAEGISAFIEKRKAKWPTAEAEEQALIDAVVESRNEARAGKLVPHEQVMRDVDALLNGRDIEASDK